MNVTMIEKERFESNGCKIPQNFSSLRISYLTNLVVAEGAEVAGS